MMTGGGAKVAVVALATALLLSVPGLVTAHPQDDPVVLAVQTAGPAVVNISAVDDRVQRRSFGNPFFDEFFNNFFDIGPRATERSSLGSGVILDGSKGHVLTNHHVVSGATRVSVTLADQTEYPAEVMGSDPASDLAVLRISPSKALPSMEMGDSDALLTGQRLIAIGNPFGLSHTVTTGVLSARNRTFKTDGTTYFDFIQTDAAINPGNSGGALLNDSGRLVGINTAIFARADGIGFAIPINKARRIASELVEHGRVRTAWVGAEVQTLTGDLKDYFDTPKGQGVVVTKVEKGSPVAISGLRRDDVVTAVGRFPISDRANFNRAVADYPPGHDMALTIYRRGKKTSVTVRPVVMPPHKAKDRAMAMLGFLVQPMDRDTARRWSIGRGEGVKVATVLQGSPAARIGLKKGDALLAINSSPINSPEEYTRLVASLPSNHPVRLVVQRGRTQYRITVQPGE